MPVDPNLLLHPLGVFTKERVVPCVMARGSNTKAPVKVTEALSESTRCASLDELEALMGHTSGMSTAFGKFDLDYEQRASMIGNSYHYELVRAVFAEMPVRQSLEETGPGVHAMRKQRREEGSAPPAISKQEEYLSGLSEQELEKELRQRWEAAGAEMARLKLTLADDHTVPFQVPRRSRFQTPEKLREAVMAATKLKLKDGQLRLVKYSHEQWICQVFAKGKGRIDAMTGEEAVRFLTDLRSLNSAITYPAHWNLEMPTLEALRADVPRWARYFSQEDVSNAFESMLLLPGQEHLLTVAPPIRLSAETFTDEELESYSLTSGEIEELKQSDEWLLQWVGVPQGLSSAAPFWNVHIADGFNKLLGQEWRDYWAQYVDDCMPYGYTREQCEARKRMLTVALRVMGKEVSSRVDREVHEYGLVAGLKFVEGGVTLCDEAVAALELALDEVLQAKRMTEKSVRRLARIMQYSASAFEWSVSDQTW